MHYPDNYVKHLLSKKKWMIVKNSITGYYSVVPYDSANKGVHGGWLFETYQEARDVCDSLNRWQRPPDAHWPNQNEKEWRQQYAYS